MNTNMLLWVVILPLVLWRVYARFQRNIGRQQFRPTRSTVYLVILAFMSLIFAALSIGHPQLLLGWFCGLVPGVMLGIWALHLTRFETTPEGRFYTPNAHIGLALSLLFVGRIIYRAIALKSNMSLSGRPPPGIGTSALTFLVFELLAGYYIAYNAGVLRRFRAPDLSAAPPV